MYKTVRKGDTSLQYTILPQTDQLASGGCPQNSGKTRPRNIKYTMGTIMILIVVSILGAPVMVNQVKYDHMVHKMMTMRQVELIVNDTYARSQTKDAAVASKNRSRIATTTTMSTAEVTRTKDLEDGTTSTLSGILREEEEEDEAVVIDDATLTGILSNIFEIYLFRDDYFFLLFLSTAHSIQFLRKYILFRSSRKTTFAKYYDTYCEMLYSSLLFSHIFPLFAD